MTKIIYNADSRVAYWSRDNCNLKVPIGFVGRFCRIIDL